MNNHFMAELGAVAMQGRLILAGWDPRAVAAGGLTAAFALMAWGLRAVTAGGALAGFAVTFLLCLAAGPGAFTTILAVFVLTWISTRIGRRQKERFGTTERQGGRTASQILANLAAAAICAAPILFVPRSAKWVLVGTVAALAESAADTMSSELGQVFSRRALLITNFKPVPAGTDGGITVLGSMAGVFGAIVTAAIAVWADVIALRWFPLIVAAAVTGMVLDSYLGAWLERPGRLGNDSVNFTSSSTAAFLAILVAFLVRIR